MVLCLGIVFGDWVAGEVDPVSDGRRKLISVTQKQEIRTTESKSIKW